MVKVNKQTLLSKFRNGMKPTEEDFASFIESTYTMSDIEFYSSQGLFQQPVKFLVGTTTVQNNEGMFEVNYAHVPHVAVAVVIPIPQQNANPSNASSLVISCNILSHGGGKSTGKAFLSADSITNGIEHNSPAPIGSVIQYLAVLI